MGRFAACLLALGLAAGCGDDSGGGGEDAGGDTDTGPGIDSGPEVDAGPAPDDTGPPCLCTADADCDDGVFCNGTETCMDCACMAGTAVACDDGMACTIDACSEERRECTSTGPDLDGDGFIAATCGGTDCDDSASLVFPGAIEVCDAADRDEDCNPSTFGSRDLDGDTHTDADCCNGTNCGLDCDDARSNVSPDDTEVCDGLDNDCDGMRDDGVEVAGFFDGDGDLHGDPTMPRMACAGTPRFSVVNDDCDDMNRTVHGSQPEVCDSVDNDCDTRIDEGAVPVTWYRDADGDGFGHEGSGTTVACTPPPGHSLVATDCDDGRATVNPGAAEACNGTDDDCNGIADFSIGTNDSEDDDGDGYTDSRCAGGDDCNDDSWDTRPGAAEICDLIDNDCDGMIDVGTTSVLWYVDSDGDGFGDDMMPPVDQCERPMGRTTRAGDCNDGDPAVRPGRPDTCDGVDQDCDMTIDEGGTRIAWYPDADRDGFGSSMATLACAMPPGHVSGPGDCDDGDVTIYPAARETCDADDDDCDTTIDEGADAECMLANATSTCSSGACAISMCNTGFQNCDMAAASGCEVDVRTDDANCGTCGNACTFGPNSTNDCLSSTCNFTCTAGFANCDMNQTNGCEINTNTDVLNCGRCGGRCSVRTSADPACAMGTCAITCWSGFLDCNAMVTDGCEVDSRNDEANCGGCGNTCIPGDVCVRGSCLAHPFPSTGAEGAFAPTANVVLAPGIHHFTTITIPAGVTVTTNGAGELELYATGDVVINGVIDVTGGRGGNGCATTVGTGVCNGGGGATGNPLAPGLAGAITFPCRPSGGGGTGADGFTGSDGAGGCGAGGTRGGGAGGGRRQAGGGGGGYAGGGAGGAAGDGGTGGNGAFVSGASMGGTGGVTYAGGTGGESTLADPIYSGANGLGRRCGTDVAGGGGGGSIGADAIMDLAIMDVGGLTTFRAGSGGGAGGGNSSDGGGGGGGGGGALRIASPTRIIIGTGAAIRANGGGGGNAARDSGGNGGGGSGGVIYLAAPTIENDGSISAVGGAGNTVGGACRGLGGNGGMGRIRLSVLPENCSALGNWNPLLSSGCAPTMPAVPGRVFIGEYPF